MGYSSDENNLNSNNSYKKNDDMEDIYSNLSGKTEYKDISSTSNKKIRKSSYKTKRFINILIAVLTVVFAIIGTGLLYVDSLMSSINYDNTLDDIWKANPSLTLDSNLKKDPNLLRDPKVLNVMLFGIDDESRKNSGEGGPGGSDTMILLSIDNRHKKIKLTSFMRDIWVDAPGYVKGKLNASFSAGGPNESVRAIEKLFGINIDRCASVHFKGFMQIVDAMGGLDIDITKEEASVINKKLHNYAPEDIQRDLINDNLELYDEKKDDLPIKDGSAHLSGVQTLLYATDRYSSGDDFGRTQRQRKIINTAIQKVKNLSFPKIASIAQTLFSNITVNLSKVEAEKLIANTVFYKGYEVVQMRIPEDDNYTNERENDGSLALEITDLPLARYNLAKFIYEDSIKTK